MPGAIVERGERVTLRTAEREDVPFLQRSFAAPELRYPLGNVRPRNQEQVAERFEDETSTKLLVCLDGAALPAADRASGPRPRADGGDASRGQPDENRVTPIGAITVTDVDWSRTDLAYWLVPEYHGEGYGTEAVSLAVDHVFRTIDTPSLGAGVYDFNEASHGLLESLGFTREGRLRKTRYVDGEYRDRIQYGLLRTEWRKQRDA